MKRAFRLVPIEWAVMVGRECIGHVVEMHNEQPKWEATDAADGDSAGRATTRLRAAAILAKQHFKPKAPRRGRAKPCGEPYGQRRIKVKLPSAGGALREAREKSKRSQGEIGKLANLSRVTVAKYEAGDIAKLDELAALCGVLALDWRDLLSVPVPPAQPNTVRAIDADRIEGWADALGSNDGGAMAAEVAILYWAAAKLRSTP